MKSRIAKTVLLGVFWLAFALAVAWPTVALIGRCVAEGQPPEGGFLFSARQLGLLWRSTWLAVVAAFLCLFASLPAAFVLGRLRRLSDGPLIAALLMGVILCPPTVLAFGWERIFPSAVHGYLRCVTIWALWAWPIPAMLIGTGWSRVGRRAFEDALLVASPAKAFFRVALPSVQNYIALASLILFVLFFGDYVVPHACLLTVYATELLGWARSSSHPIDTVWPALTSVAIVGLVLAAVCGTARACAQHDDVDPQDAAPDVTSPGLTVLTVVCFVISWLLPLGALVAKMSSPRAIVDAFRVYGADLAWSLGLAILSGLIAVGMGVGLVAVRNMRATAFIWALALGALPGALVGEALVAAYNHNATWWIYDHWPVMVLCYVARFGWIGIITALLLIERLAPSLVDQARTDGATEVSILGRLHIPLTWPALMCGAGVIAAVSVADVASSSLVRIPSYSPIAHILFEKFHRFEDDMLISLSLWLIVATWPAAVLLAVALRRRRGH